jgi:hypothetical protein
MNTDKIFYLAGIGFLSFFLSAYSLFGQNILTGKITKLPYNEPKYARVTLEDTLTHQRFVTHSDTLNEGKYEIDNIPTSTSYKISFEPQADTITIDSIQIYHFYSIPLTINSDTTYDHPAFPFERWGLFDTTAIYATKLMTHTLDRFPNHRLIRMKSPIKTYAHKTNPPDNQSQPDWAAPGYYNTIFEINAKCKNVKLAPQDTNIVNGITYLYVEDGGMPDNAHGLLGYTENDRGNGETKEIYHSTVWFNTQYNDPSDSGDVQFHETIWSIGLIPSTMNTSSIFYLYGRPRPMQLEDAKLIDMAYGIPIGYDMSGYKNDSLVTGDISTGVNIGNITQAIPQAFSLGQNYPNPFNPSTNIGFRIVEVGYVTLKIFDVLGRKVTTLVNEMKQPSEYKVKWNAEGVQSGVYFYRLSTGKYTEVKKMLLLK